MLKHYKGDGSLYSYNRYKDDPTKKEEHKNGIFFDTTKHLIYLNGETYGGGGGDAGDLKTTKDIRISGGPLALEFLKDSGDNSEGLDKLPDSWKSGSDYKIPANTSLTDIIRLLFECEVWPSPEDSEGSIKASFLSPTFTLTDSRTIMEVGDYYEITAITTGQASVTPTDPEVKTFDYGYYKLDLTGKYTVYVDDKEASATMGTRSFKTTSDYIFTLNLSGCTVVTPPSSGYSDNVFTYKFSPTNITSTQSALTEGQKIKFKIDYGSNTFSYEQKTSSVLQATSPAIPSYLIVSSLGNHDSDHMSPSCAEATKECGITKYSSSHEVIGVFPIYTTGNFRKITQNISKDEPSIRTEAEGTTNEYWPLPNLETDPKNAASPIREGRDLSLIKIPITSTKTLTNLTNDSDNCFWLYIAFGFDTLVNDKNAIEEADLKLVFLPKGWEIVPSELNSSDDIINATSAGYDNFKTHSFNAAIEIKLLGKSDRDTHSSLSTFGNLNWDEEASTFKIQSSNNYVSEYTVWQLNDNTGGLQTYRLKVRELKLNA